jgi:hypothetical protein
MLIRNIPRPERRDSGEIGAEFDPLRRQTLRIGWFLLAILAFSQVDSKVKGGTR